MKHLNWMYGPIGLALLSGYALTSCTSDSELSEWRAQNAEAVEIGAEVAEPDRLAPVAASEESVAEPAPVSAPEPEPRLAALESIDPAVEVESKDGSVTLWLTDKPSKQRVQRLIKKASQSMSAKFSADNKWIVVSDQAFSDLETVYLFKRSGSTSYRKVDRDAFTGVIWDQFASEKLGPQYMITKYRTTFQGWGEGSLRLKLAALPRGGEWIEKDYSVELAGL